MSAPTDPAPASGSDAPVEAAPDDDAARPSWVRRTRSRLRRLPRSLRWSAYVAMGLVLVLVVGLVAVAALVRRPLPETSGEATLAGLSAGVEVVRDEHGIPQIYGTSDADLLRAQGYVHAQERFFEMDVRRHITAGRLSEMFGPDTVETDRFVRTLGWRRVAEQELPLLQPETRAALEAYADGVNAFLDDRGTTDIAVEYTLLAATGLDYTPEPWTPVDSLAWLKAMAWDLRGNMEEEIDRVLVAADHPAARAAQLFPAYPYDEHPPIVTGGGVVDGVFEQDATGNSTRNPLRPAPAALDRLADLERTLGRIPALIGKGDGIGSNSWVVDGDHSSTGAPILANDPHLGVSMPGIWMQAGLHCREIAPDCTLDVSGFTFSGVPGVVIGHNADVAWGFTNLGPDVTDLYLEKVEGDSWLYDGELRPLETRTETIEVAGGDDVELTVRSTAHGPIVSDVSADLARVGAEAQVSGAAPPARDDGYAVSLAWTALRPGRTADAILALNRASDWESFRAAASSFEVPAQNLVYADREGHIGYQAPGLVPIRKSGNDGRTPSAGWRPENDWTGEFVPFDGLPSVLDPEEGFVVTANQAVIGPDYPYFLTDDWDQGYRATRIRQLLEEEGELSVGEMQRAQLDTRNPMAATLVPRLLDVEGVPEGYPSDGLRLLETWDQEQPADSPAAAYYNVVWRTLLEMTFHDDLREEAWPDGGDRWFAVMEDLLDAPADPWWDDAGTEEVETRDDILRSALIEARDEMTRLQARNPDDWSWGHLHQLDLESQTLGQSGIGAVEALVNRGGWEVGGGGSIVDATSWDAREGYGVTAAPSMRMVISLADFDDSRWINLSGVSGHPASGHYADQTDLWARGEYLPWAFSPDAVEAAGEDTLTLVPAEE